MTSSTKLEVHNVLHCRQLTETRPQVTRTENLVKFGRVVFEICERINKQTDRHADRHTSQPYWRRRNESRCQFVIDTLILHIHLQHCRRPLNSNKDGVAKTDCHCFAVITPQMHIPEHTQQSAWRNARWEHWWRFIAWPCITLTFPQHQSLSSENLSIQYTQAIANTSHVSSPATARRNLATINTNVRLWSPLKPDAVPSDG